MWLEWAKCTGDVWCLLEKLDLEHKNLKGVDGVYIMWAEEGGAISVIKVGYGNIVKELQKNKQDRAIIPFFAKKLKISWAEAPILKRKGIIAYLHKKCHPKITDEVPNVTPIEVNLPWE